MQDDMTTDNARDDASTAYELSTIEAAPIEAAPIDTALVDERLDCHWWASALMQRWDLDREILAMKAAAGVEVPAPPPAAQGRPPVHWLGRTQHEQHELTDWERAWIIQRIQDAHTKHEERLEQAQKLLAEPHEVHLRRELDAKARVLFRGRTHAEQLEELTRYGALVRQTYGVVSGEDRPARLTEAHFKAEALPSDAVARAAQLEELNRKHAADYARETAMMRDAYQLVQRHIAMVTKEVADERERAAQRQQEHDVLKSEPLHAQMPRVLAQVEAEIRRGRAPKPPAPQLGSGDDASNA